MLVCPTTLIGKKKYWTKYKKTNYNNNVLFLENLFFKSAVRLDEHPDEATAEPESPPPPSIEQIEGPNQSNE